MKRSISLVRPSLKKYRNLILGVTAFLVATAYPGYLMSQELSANIIIDKLYRAGEEVIVDYDVDLKVYENISGKVNVSFSEKVIDAIKNAEKEIYIAMYSFNLEDALKELINAKNRGVKVVIYYPYEKSDTFDEFLAEDKGELDVRYVGKYEKEEDYYHMHHKFMIVDEEVLLTGPWNWSHFQEDLDPNILIETHDKEIIKSYMNEISRIDRGFSGYNKFRDLAYVPWEKQINYPNEDYVEVWWSPGRRFNSIESRAVNLIDNAEETIDISMTIFDSYRISRKLINKAKEGIMVRLIADINLKYDENSNIRWLENKIQEQELGDYFEIYDGGVLPTDENSEYSIFHHHNMVVDNEFVLTSTANWTHGGFFLNDENTLIIKNKLTADRFTEIFNNYLTYKY
ncbi:phosphatidylserine/phosphatidylglycerophosphate/cardiolipin synthase family protein [Patescibacteria group bacterium]